MTTLLHAVADVARIAGDVAMSHFRSALNVETKGDGSPVTIADRAAERAAREWIAARFPRDGILGEEEGLSDASARRRWIVDPIDGTKTFVRGVPLWGTLVAVAEDEDVLAGAAYFPAVGEMLAAAPGEGCWWNDVRCRVSTVDALGTATVLTTDEQFTHRPDRREAWRRVAESSGIVRSWGDCYGYLLVATGRAEMMCDAIVGDWDIAPFLPIIEEAGGVLTDWDGRRTAFGRSAIATNAVLGERVRTLMGPTGADGSMY